MAGRPGTIGGVTGPIEITLRAQALLEQLQEEHRRGGHSLAFIIAGGCCENTAPLLTFADTVVPGADVRLGEVAGVPLFAPAAEGAWLERYGICLDVLAEGRLDDSFSLEVHSGQRFRVTFRPLKESSRS